MSKPTPSPDVGVVFAARPHGYNSGDIDIELMEIVSPSEAEHLKSCILCNIQRLFASKTISEAGWIINSTRSLSAKFNQDNCHIVVSWHRRATGCGNSSYVDYYRRVGEVKNWIVQVTRLAIQDEPEFRGLSVEVDVQLSDRLSIDESLANLLDQQTQRRHQSAFSLFVATLAAMAVIVILVRTGSGPLDSGDLALDVIQMILLIIMLVGIGYAVVCTIRVRQYAQRVLNLLEAGRDAD